MSKLMFIFGILFLAAGVALGFLIHFSPGEMQVRGLTAGCGGNSCCGRRPVPGPWQHHRSAARPDRWPGRGGSRNRSAGTPAEKPATPKFTGFGKKTAATAVVAEASAAVAETAAASKTSVADTVAALEQAKTDIAVALGVEPQKAAAAEPVVAIAEPEAKPEADSEELYVVEEKVIRGRPARVLSDGTVEAETDDGWMRFENLEHLDEYLEAMVPEA